MDTSTNAIIERFKYSFPTLFRSYVTRAQWTTVGDVNESGLLIENVRTT